MRSRIDLIIRRLAITSVLAAVPFVVLSLLLPNFLPAIFNPPYDSLGYAAVWGSLFVSWPYLVRRLSLLSFLEKHQPPGARSPNVRLPLGSRLLRCGLVIVVGVLVVVLVVVLASVPARLSARKARSDRDSVRIGMTVSEVFHSVRGWRFLTANSASPHEENDPNAVVHLVNHEDQVDISESQALALLHERLHGGYEWRFTYTYVSVSPVHFFFTVVIGPDGRVTAVTPVQGAD